MRVCGPDVAGETTPGPHQGDEEGPRKGPLCSLTPVSVH